MKVEIWSDIVCPFCYIGKTKYDLALDNFTHREQIVTEFRSFELDPTTDSSLSMNTYDMLAKKYGMSTEQAKHSSNQLVEQAKAVGLSFQFDGLLVLNTLDAHRLTHYAKQFDKVEALSAALFEAYFTHNLNIDDHDQLVDIAEKVGLDREQARQALQTDQFKDDVRSDEQEANQLGIRGVPYFVIDRKYAISGAQDSQVFLQALEQACAEKWSTL